MGAFSILGHVAQGFNEAANTDRERAFKQDMVARDGATKAIDAMIASGAIDQTQIPELLQRRMAIMAEPYKPYKPGKTPSWGKYADLSTLKYQPPTPPPNVAQPSQVPVGRMATAPAPGAGYTGAGPANPATTGAVAGVPANLAPLNAVPQPTVAFQPPTPPPTSGLHVLSPQERGTQAGKEKAAELGQVLPSEIALAQARWGGGRLNSIQQWEDKDGNPIDVLVNRGTGAVEGVNGQAVPEGAHPVAGTLRNVVAQMPDGSRVPAFENKFGRITDANGDVLEGAAVIPTATLPTERTSNQSYNAETGTTTTSSTSQKAIGGPTPPPSAKRATSAAPARPTSASVTGKTFGTWTAPRLDSRGYSVTGGLADVVDDIRKGSAVAGEAWDWANIGKAPQGGAKQQAAVRSYMGRHGLEPTLGPSTQARSRAAAADSMRPIINRAIDLIQQNRDKLGVFSGRASEFEKRIGNIAPQAAALYGDLKSIYSFAGTMHGWRALQVADEFESAFGGLHTNPDATIAALRELDRTAVETARSGGGTLSSSPIQPATPPPSSAASQGVWDATATGPDGHRIGARGGKWYDMSTGQPLPTPPPK